MAIGVFLKRSLTRLSRDRSGIGAVEFSFIAPVLIFFVLGGSELGVALTIDRKVKEAAGYTSDLVSQSTELSDTDLPKLFGLAKATLAPYSIQPLRMRVVQAKVTSDGKAIVDWSCQSRGFDPIAPGTAIAVPPNLVPAPKVSKLEPDDLWGNFSGDYRDLIVPVHVSEEDQRRLDEHLKKHNPAPTPPQKLRVTTAYVIYAEAEYDFSPLTGQVFTGTVPLNGKTFSLPRYSEKVASNGCSTFDL